MTYELLWKCVPMGPIASYEKWYDPFLGQGVYMLVVATNDGKYVGYYVGKSNAAIPANALRMLVEPGWG